MENQIVYQRSCYWKPANGPAEQCFDSTPQPSYVQNIRCQLCDTDGCNGAPQSSNGATQSGNSTTQSGNGATQFGPIALFLIIPIAVARSFLI